MSDSDKCNKKSNLKVFSGYFFWFLIYETNPDLVWTFVQNDHYQVNNMFT